jgi:hypothetical protein
MGSFLFSFTLARNGAEAGLEFVGVVSDIRMSDAPTKTPDPDFTNTGEEDLPTEDFKSYTWFKFSAVDPVGPFDLRNFRDIDTEDPVVPSQLISSFAYAFLLEEFEEAVPQEQAVTTTFISVERDLRKYLIVNLKFTRTWPKIIPRSGKNWRRVSHRRRKDENRHSCKRHSRQLSSN